MASQTVAAERSLLGRTGGDDTRCVFEKTDVAAGVSCREGVLRTLRAGLRDNERRHRGQAGARRSPTFRHGPRVAPWPPASCGEEAPSKRRFPRRPEGEKRGRSAKQGQAQTARVGPWPSVGVERFNCPRSCPARPITDTGGRRHPAQRAGAGASGLLGGTTVTGKPRPRRGGRSRRSQCETRRERGDDDFVEPASLDRLLHRGEGVAVADGSFDLSPRSLVEQRHG